jgi:hypothetical protein
MGERNRHGLGRYVPRDVQREVRKRCGYGCVICGLGLYDYEHFDPDFKDAVRHDPAGMTLLCMQCNQKRARGTLSAETVARANQRPKCKEQGFASEMFDFGPEPVEVQFAGLTLRDCRVLIKVCGVELLSFKPPEAPHSPVRLSGRFADVTGATTLKIEDNVWSAGEDNWDVEIVGPRIIIRRGPGDIALAIRTVPPHLLIVETLDMVFERYHLKGNAETFEFSPDGKHWSSLTGSSASGWDVGFQLD